MAKLMDSGHEIERQRTVPVVYEGRRLDCGFRLDLLVAKSVIVEIKAVDAIAPIHQAQLLTYLKLTGLKVGLIINFNVLVLRHGIKRMINGFLLLAFSVASVPSVVKITAPDCLRYGTAIERVTCT